MTELNKPPMKRGVPIWIQVIVWMLLVALLALVGLILSKRQQGAIRPGAMISDFGMTLYSGYEYQDKSEVRLSDFAGRVVALNFWASWCKPCEQEAAELEEVSNFYEPTGRVVFLGVDYADTPNEAKIYLKKFGITFPNGPADAHPDYKLSQLFRITGVPETYFIDQTGVLKFVKVGPFVSTDEIKSIIDQMLQ